MAKHHNGEVQTSEVEVSKRLSAPRRRRAQARWGAHGAALLFLFSLFVPNANAQQGKSAGGSKFMISGKSVHMSCSRGLRDLAKNRLECFGNVYARRTSELLTSDYALLDMNANTLHAEGNVVYFTPDTVIYGAKMDFNFESETGFIEDGRVESDKYELMGERIERLSSEHFRARDGEYTTCRDCPASWRLGGRTIDLTVNGYAHLSHVFIKINEAPTFYLPYMIVPVKTQRQTGLLFPRQGATEQDGITLIEPFYWAISRSTDATLGLGFYSKKGFKSEGEFRYSLSDRSHGQFNGFYLRDKQFPFPNRWATQYTHNIVLPWKLEQKFHYLDASDRDYARRYPGDIPGVNEPGLVSDLGLSRSGRDMSGWVNAKRIRNNITPGLVGFDPNTVQLYPTVSLATADHRISDEIPLHWGLGANYSRFWRSAASFDTVLLSNLSQSPPDQFIPGVTPLRRAQRFNLVPELYYTARAWDVLELIPSVQYRAYFYSFDRNFAPPTARGYLVAQTEVATTVERVYGGTIKHKFRPSLTYSNIPIIEQDPFHPFNQQIKVSGNQFDDNDIVPISNESQVYFVPLGNSLSYRFGNKFILKSDDPVNSYKKVVDVTAGQSVNFIEFRDNPHPRPLSRFFTLASLSTVRVNADGEYYYYPYPQRGSTYSLGMSYIIAKYSRRLLVFERSLGLRYTFNQITSHSNEVGANLTWSLNDYFRALAGITYQFPYGIESAINPGIVKAVNGGLIYQSPSQCYNLVFTVGREFGKGWAVNFNVPVNLSGEGFMSLTDGSGLPGASLAPGQK